MRSFFRCYIVRWVIFLYCPMGRFFRCYIVRWVVFKHYRINYGYHLCNHIIFKRRRLNINSFKPPYCLRNNNDHSRTKRPFAEGCIYEGTINRLMEYGAFANIETAEGRKEGLLHINEMKKNDGRLVKPEDCVSKKQKVYVKVWKSVDFRGG